MSVREITAYKDSNGAIHETLADAEKANLEKSLNNLIAGTFSDINQLKVKSFVKRSRSELLKILQDIEGLAK